MIYLIVLIVFLYPVIRQSSTKNNISPKYYWFQLVLIILLAGLRNNVGGDTIAYMRDWERCDDIFHVDSYTLLYMSVFYRPLTLGLFLLCRTISTEFFVWQLAEAIIVNTATFYIVQKETKYKYEVVLFFLIFQFLYFNTEIMREAIAASGFYFAFRFYDEQKWLKYYVALIVVFLLHDSVFIFFFFPLIHKFIDKKFTVSTMLILYFSGFIVFKLLLPNLVSLLPGNRGETFLLGYGAWENETIFGTLKTYFMAILYFIILKYEEDKHSSYVLKGYHIFIALTIWGIFLPIISGRMSNYVRLFSFIVFVSFIWNHKRLLVQKILIVMLLFNSYRYYFKDVSGWVGAGSSEKYYFYEVFYPYYSIFEEPDQNVVDRRIKIYDQEEVHANK